MWLVAYCVAQHSSNSFFFSTVVNVWKHPLMVVPPCRCGPFPVLACPASPNTLAWWPQREVIWIGTAWHIIAWPFLFCSLTFTFPGCIPQSPSSSSSCHGTYQWPEVLCIIKLWGIWRSPEPFPSLAPSTTHSVAHSLHPSWLTFSLPTALVAIFHLFLGLPTSANPWN